MKIRAQLVRMVALCCFVTTFFTACQNDDGANDLSETAQNEFAESPIISLDEIDAMTQETIDGELTIPEETETDGATKAAKFSNFKVSRERRVFDFSGTVTRGPKTGDEISGKLKLHYTLYHASFTIVRGFLELPDGTRARARGAIVSDGVVYIIINLPGRDFILGVGKAQETGAIEGRFRLLGSSRNFGVWEASLVKTVIPNQTIVELAVVDGRFTTLVGALQAADLVETLSGPGPFTVFAPTDSAFEALEAIPEGETLKEVLLYHVASGRLNTPALLRKQMITSLQGEEIKISLNDANEIVINDTVKLLSANIGGSNGVLQIIDAVLIPPSFVPTPSIVELAIATPELSTLVGALQAADLVEALQGEGPFTVFAPTNSAFEALDAIPEGDALKEVLLYHVAAGKFTAADLLEKQTVTTLQGDEVTIEMVGDKVLLNGTVEVAIANIPASNGIVHVISSVLIPPVELPSIVELAVATPDLSTLVWALQAADLVEALQGEGPFTVFAPTNSAFEALAAIPEGDALKEVLLYHVAAGKFTAADLLEKQTVNTLQGDEVTIEMVGDKVLLNGTVEVAIADIPASNGIVHVISSVLIPPVELPSIVELAIATPELSTLVSALQTADLVEALQGEGPFTVFAPTNAAFNALHGLPEGDALKEVLLYHVVSGKFTAAELAQEHEVTTLQGQKITIQSTSNGMLILNHRVRVAIQDIQASNGIVHVITNVLLP